MPRPRISSARTSSSFRPSTWPWPKWPGLGDPQFQASGRAVATLLGFFGGPADGASLIAFSDKTGEAMTKVTQRRPAPTYLKPGQELEPAWLPGVKVHVLGPPEDPGPAPPYGRQGG